MDKSITIIIPVHNGASTLKNVIESLIQQKNKSLIDTIIFIDDNSSDNSLEIINSNIGNVYKHIIIKHSKSFGLAYSYNEGIRLVKSKLFVLMHQDIILTDNYSIDKLSSRMKDAKILAKHPTLLHPRKIWEKYNMWQKCLFDRFIDKKIENLTGKFDVFDTDIFNLNFPDGFDFVTFRSAGEDGDLKEKILENKLIIEPSKIEVVHLHNVNNNFSYKDYLKKESQMAETYGTLTRLYGIRDLRQFLLMNFRQILFVCIFINYFNINAVSVFLILIYSILYSYNTIVFENNIISTFKIIIVNLVSILYSQYFWIRGFVTKHQTL